MQNISKKSFMTAGDCFFIFLPLQDNNKVTLNLEAQKFVKSSTDKGYKGLLIIHLK